MGQGAIDYIGVKGGLDINGIIESYYVYAGENISAGDFVEFVNGISSANIVNTSLTKLSDTNPLNNNISIAKLTENKVVIFYGTSSSDFIMYGIVVNIEKGIITYGAETLIDSNTNSGYGIACESIDDSHVFIAHSLGDTYTLQGTICTINGLGITVSSTNALSTSSTYNQWNICIEKLGYSSTGATFLVSHPYSSSKYMYCMIVNTTLTAIATIGTDTQIKDSAGVVFYAKYRMGKYITLVKNTPKIFITGQISNGTYSLGAVICTYSGFVITVGTAVQLNTNSYSGYGASVCLVNYNGYLFITHMLNGNSPYYIYSIVCSVSGTTITVGTDTLISSTVTATQTITNSMNIVNGRVLVLWHKSTDTGNVYYNVCTISVRTITLVGTETQIPNLLKPRNTGVWIAEKMEFGTLFIPCEVYNSSTKTYYLAGQQFTIDSDDTYLRPQVEFTEYETQVRKATKVPCNGVAKTSGIGGTSTAHNEQVEIYVPDI